MHKAAMARITAIADRMNAHSITTVGFGVSAKRKTRIVRRIIPIAKPIKALPAFGFCLVHLSNFLSFESGVGIPVD